MRIDLLLLALSFRALLTWWSQAILWNILSFIMKVKPKHQIVSVPLMSSVRGGSGHRDYTVDSQDWQN